MTVSRTSSLWRPKNDQAGASPEGAHRLLRRSPCGLGGLRVALAPSRRFYSEPCRACPALDVDACARLGRRAPYTRRGSQRCLVPVWREGGRADGTARLALSPRCWDPCLRSCLVNRSGDVQETRVPRPACGYGSNGCLCAAVSDEAHH